RRPTALQDRMRDSDDDDIHDRDYDVTALANNLSQAFGYKIYGNEENEEEHGGVERDDEWYRSYSLNLGYAKFNPKASSRVEDYPSIKRTTLTIPYFKLTCDIIVHHRSTKQTTQDVYFDDDSAEVVISSLRLGDDQGSSLFTNSNWFAFQDDRIGDANGGTSSSEMMDEINLSGAINGGSNSSTDDDDDDDEVVVGEDEELTDSRNTVNGTSSSSTHILGGLTGSDSMNEGTLDFESEKASTSHDMGFYKFEATDNEDLFGDRPLPDWVGWSEPSDMQVAGSSMNPFLDHSESGSNLSSKSQLGDQNPNSSNGECVPSNGSPTTRGSTDAGIGSSQRSVAVPSLFEEDVEFVGVELEGTGKAMEQALKEGIVGEAGPLKRNGSPKVPEKENSEEGSPAVKEFNDANYWRVDQEVAVLD
ncbi:serine/threonine-protein phosphatase 6 regulatory subunit 3, partial [Trifolium pratense]